MEPCRSSYILMGILRMKNATDKVHGLTIQELHEIERLSKPNTINKRLKKLEQLGLIQEGVKAGKAKTYFLTEMGDGRLPTKREGVQE